ncbi:hypothetical protein [Candidatus Thiodictyon syntrophicum]|jgi:hypothetical protein|uniref:hypothetical protein n=1 Tax=Candidatus Thiodictyon syntrophicum TaxID=1166950 RepID=UPI0012FE326C|nr:hypothetical protein [Candidatus Thiodictyon syntrophicum]
MRSGTSKAPLVRGNLLPHSPLGAAVAQRALQVGELVVRRRRTALDYRREQSEDLRIALAHLDDELARYNINIPAIQRLTKRQSQAASTRHGQGTVN